MLSVRRALAFFAVAVLLGSSSVLAQKAGGGMSEAQAKSIQSMTTVADDMMGGRPAPNDLSLAWVHDDLLRVAQQGQAFVPFILTLDSAKTAPGPISVYVRVAPKDMPAPVAPKKDDKKAPPPPAFTYQSLTFGTATAGQPIKISRAFSAPAGAYDVYVVVREGSAEAAAKPDKNAPVPKMAAIKQTVNVPDLWNGELNTSSVIIAEKVEQLTAALSTQEKANRPYVLGGIELVPYTRAKFAKKEELLAFVLIYNAKADPAGKPDVKVEFNFYAKQAGGEKFFNSTLPTNLNGQTLSPQDLASGQLQAGQGVPLSSFPEGDYRLEIKITDNVAKKELKKEMNFSVTGA